MSSLNLAIFSGTTKIGVMPADRLLRGEDLSFGDVVNSWSIFSKQHASPEIRALASALPTLLDAAIASATSFEAASAVHPEANDIIGKAIVDGVECYILERDDMDYGLSTLTVQVAADYDSQWQEANETDVIVDNQELLYRYIQANAVRGFTSPVSQPMSPDTATLRSQTVATSKVQILQEEKKELRVDDTKITIPAAPASMDGVVLAPGFLGAPAQPAQPVDRTDRADAGRYAAAYDAGTTARNKLADFLNK